jgi:hypothetical protein
VVAVPRWTTTVPHALATGAIPMPVAAPAVLSISTVCPAFTRVPLLGLAGMLGAVPKFRKTTSPHPFVTVNAVLPVSTAGIGSVTNDPDMPEGIAKVAGAPLDTNVVGVISVWVIVFPFN